MNLAKWRQRADGKAKLISERDELLCNVFRILAKGKQMAVLSFLEVYGTFFTKLAMKVETTWFISAWQITTEILILWLSAYEMFTAANGCFWLLKVTNDGNENWGAVQLLWGMTLRSVYTVRLDLFFFFGSPMFYKTFGILLKVFPLFNKIAILWVK